MPSWGMVNLVIRSYTDEQLRRTLRDNADDVEKLRRALAGEKIELDATELEGLKDYLSDLQRNQDIPHREVLKRLKDTYA